MKSIFYLDTSMGTGPKLIFFLVEKKSIEWCSHKTFDTKIIFKLYPCKNEEESLGNLQVIFNDSFKYSRNANWFFFCVKKIHSSSVPIWLLATKKFFHIVKKIIEILYGTFERFLMIISNVRLNLVNFGPKIARNEYQSVLYP